MASRSHVDNTVNERRLRPIYGTYGSADRDRGLKLVSFISIEPCVLYPRNRQLGYVTTSSEASLFFRLVGQWEQ